MERYKRPDKKNALSILEASKREMDYTLSLKLGEESGPTIIRNIYESFRMLGDALLVNKGIESQDHLAPLRELSKMNVKTKRPIELIETLRILRHNINYYGYKPKVLEVEDVINFAKAVFYDVFDEVKKRIDEN
mgnify:CR=1 FL=1